LRHFRARGSRTLTHKLSLNLLRRIAACAGNLIDTNAVLRHRVPNRPVRLNARTTELRVGALDKLLNLVVAKSLRLTTLSHPHRNP
jgi:hypothetical protein